MNRNDKMGAFALGAALFLSLGYFIYTSWKSTPLAVDTFAEDMAPLDDYDFNEDLGDEGAGAETDAPAAKTPDATPAPATEAK